MNMDDSEFNLSNTIGIGLNIGEQMMLPVANGTEEAELVIQQQQQLQQQQEQHLMEQQQQQQAQYESNLNMSNVNNSPETTNVTCLDNSMGNFYQENTDLADLSSKLAETTKILNYTPVEKSSEILTSLPEDSVDQPIVEELGSITNVSNSMEQAEAEKAPDDQETHDKEKEDTESLSKPGDKESKDNEGAEVEEDVEEGEPAQEEGVGAGEETDLEEEVEEVAEEDEDEVDEEIIPDEVIVPEDSKDAVKHIKETKTPKAEEDDADETNKDANEENEDSQNNEGEESEEPSSTARRARRVEEQIDENQCRVCCSKENLVSIFKRIEQRTVAELLMSICPSVSISIQDFLPQYICNPCCDNVEMAIKLKNQCETAEKEFRKKLSRHKNKIRRPVGYVVIDAPLDSDPPTDEEPANDEEFKVSDIASATPSEESDSSDYSDSKKKRRTRKRRKSAVVTPTEGKKFKNNGQSSDEEDDDGDPIKQKRKRSTNSSPENFDCNECGQSFSRKQSLVLHQRGHLYGRGEPIKCEVCGKKFKIKGAYRTHLEKHKEERRAANKCNQCPKRFNSSTDLKRHIAEQHRERIILPSCSKCNRTFSSSGRLQRHKQNGCYPSDSTKPKKSESSSTFMVGTDLFKTVAPLQSTYWSDSFSD